MIRRRFFFSFFYPQLVAKEMQNLFGDQWEMYVIIRPPWSVVTVLKCALKHWIAAISESFLRGAESILKELSNFITGVPVGGRKLKDVSYFLEKCSDLIQSLKPDKYTDSYREAANSIDVITKVVFW